MIKENDIMKLIGKWTQIIIRSVLNKVQKEKLNFLSFVDTMFESTVMCVLFGITSEVKKLLWSQD